MKKLVCITALVLGAIVLVCGTLFIFSEHSIYSQRMASPASQPYVFLGIREDAEIERDAFKALLTLIKEHPNDTLFTVEWKRCHFLGSTWNSRIYGNIDNGSLILCYDRSSHSLFLASPLQKNYDWGDVQPVYIDRASREGISIRDFSQFGCRSQLPG